MKKYLFIGGPPGGQYHETNGDVTIMWCRSPIFTVDESSHTVAPLGVLWAYNLRTLTIGDDHTPVYVLSTMCNAEIIDLLLENYVRS